MTTKYDIEPTMGNIHENSVYECWLYENPVNM